MAWSSEFLAFISAPVIIPSWYVRILDTMTGWGGSWKAATEKDRFGTQAGIVPGSVQISGSRLNVSTWTASGGSFSFAVPDVAEVLPFLTRGDILVLGLGQIGWDASRYQDIAIGVVSNIRSNGSRQARIECLDGLAAMRCRLAPDVAGINLFNDIDVIGDDAVTLSSAYNGGATMNITGSTTQFSRETGKRGCVRVHTSPPAFVTYSNASGAQFTGCIKDALGSTHINAAAGTPVTEVALLRGIPHEVYARVLSSTGVFGDNGVMDVYPTAWGLGIRENFIDAADIALWRDAYVAGTGLATPSWDYVCEAPITDGLAFWSAAFKVGGFYPMIRQGRFTMHHARRFGDEPVSSIEITNDDIAAGASAIDYSAFNEGQPYEFSIAKAAVKITLPPFLASLPPFLLDGIEEALGIDDDEVFAESAVADPIATLPAAEKYETVLSNPAVSDARMLYGPGPSTFLTDMLTDTVERLESTAQRVHERVRIRCSGLRLSQLSLGERPLLSTSRVFTRSTASERRPIVIGVDVDWNAGVTTLDLLLRPNYSGPYPG